VGYCHRDHGCKIAVDGLKGANGIARSHDGLYFVSSDNFGEISVLERQDDDTLVLVDMILTGEENLTVMVVPRLKSQ
jgi:hypothetical protein